MLKQEAKISVFFLITIIFFGLILTNATEISNLAAIEKNNDKLNQISAPKSSVATVEQRWNETIPYTNPIVDISEDGQYIVTKNNTHTILKDWNNNKIWTYQSASGYFFDLKISSDGEYIVVTDTESYVYLLNKTAETLKKAMWYSWWGSPTDTFCDISANGKKIAVAVSLDLYLFNNTYSGLQEKQEEWTYSSGGPSYNALAMTPDGKYIAAGCSDGYVYLFNTTYTNPKTWEKRFDTTASVNRVDISADGKFIIAGNNANELWFFNTTDYQGKPMWNYTMGALNLIDLDISSLGTHIVAGFVNLGNGEGVIYQFNNTYFTGNKIPEWTYSHGAGNPLASIAISSDSKYIIAGFSITGTGACILLFNTTNSPKQSIWSFSRSNNPSMYSVAISGTGEYFATTDESNNRLHFFYHDVPEETQTQLIELWDHSTAADVVDVDISKDGNYIAAINISSVYFLGHSSNTTLWRYSPGIAWSSLGISYDGMYIAAASGPTCRAYLLNKSQTTPKTPMWSYYHGSAVSPFLIAISDYRAAIAVAASTELLLFNKSYDSDPGNKEYEWICTTIGGAINSIAVSSDGEKIVVGANDGYIYFLNTTKKTPKTYEWKFNTTSNVKKVDIGYNIGKDMYLITCYNDDNEVYLLNSTYENPKTAMWNYTGSTGVVNDLVISDIGNYIVAGDDSGYIHVLDDTYSSNKKVVWTNKILKDRIVKSVDISSDGRYIVVGYSTLYDPEWIYLLRLFDTSKTSPDEPKSWGLTKSITKVAISGIGDYIAVGTPNPHIYLCYHYVYIPQVIRTIISGGDDDEEGNKEPLAIPFGNYYLIVIPISVISLIILKKRKVILKEK